MTTDKPNIDELDEILNDLAPLHDDGDYGVCASNFSICQVCGRKEYFMNIAFHPCTHTAVSRWVPQECDCEIGKRITEAKAKLHSMLIEAENRGKASCDIAADQPNDVHIGYFNKGFEAGVRKCREAMPEKQEGEHERL